MKHLMKQAPGTSWRSQVIVRRAGLLLSQQDFEWRWSVPLFQCLTVLEFSFILFDLCLLTTFFNLIMNYVPIVTFWIFTYHKIWILSIMFCFIWSYWIIYFLALALAHFTNTLGAHYANLVKIYGEKWWPDQVIILHMPWQLSCHSMCKIVIRLRNENRKIFMRFNWWAHRLIVKWIPSLHQYSGCTCHGLILQMVYQLIIQISKKKIIL